MHSGYFLLSFITALLIFGSAAPADDSISEKYHYGPASVPLLSGSRLYVYTQGGKTFAKLIRKGQSPSSRISLSRGDYTDPKSTFANLAIVGQTAGGVTIIKETYHTNASPMGYCGAGEEEAMQIITNKPVFKQTFFLKIASCVTNINLDDINFNPKTSILSIHWSMKDDCDEKREYKIGNDGNVTQISSQRRNL